MSEVGDAIRELAHVVKTEDEIEGIALQVDDMWNRVQAHREATPAIATDTTSEVARVLGEHSGFYLRENGPGDDWYVCDPCGVELETLASAVSGEFYAHQAAMLAEAGLLREFPGRVDGADSGETSNNSECPCAACDPGQMIGGDNPIWFASRMNVCPDCGNKRCPKAANHAKWQCSGSNETGQQGVPVPAEQPQADSAGRGASGGLGERLRALMLSTVEPGTLAVALPVGELRKFADEAHRLEVHARVVEQSLRTARAEGDGARIKGEQWKARYEETRDANRRVLQVAQWFRGQGQTGYARKVEEAVGGMEGALNADHPLGKVIGVIREFGTEHYKTEEAPAGSPFRMPEDRAPVADRPLGRTAGELFGPSGVTLPALEASRITFAPELQAELNEQIDQWGKRLAARIRAEMGLAPNEEGS